MSNDDALFDELSDMVVELTEAKVEFLVVGGHAVAAHGLVRATLDIDFLVRPTRDNAERRMQALRAWGAPVKTHGEAPHRCGFLEAGHSLSAGSATSAHRYPHRN